MKAETLINIFIGVCFAGFLACVALLSYIRTDKPKQKPTKCDTVKTKDDCGFCGVIKTYSLNVNCYHWEE